MALTAQAATTTQDSIIAEETNTAKKTEEAVATSTAQAKIDNTATAAAFAQETQIAATETEQARQDATATELAKATSTPTDTPVPTQTMTQTPWPTLAHTNTPAPKPPSSDMIVRNPGEKSAGDHGVQIKNKTGATVTIIMYGDPFNYTFYVPEGNHKIFLRPGFYSFTFFSCGGSNSGSGVFNSNWVWTFFCN
jgi:hypothetical protein